jgi:hypothetical protein
MDDMPLDPSEPSDQQIRAERKRLEKRKKYLIKKKSYAEYSKNFAERIVDEMLDEFHNEKNSSGRIQPWKDAIKRDNKLINELEDKIAKIEKQLAALKPVKSESILTQVANLPSRLFRTTRMLTVAPSSGPTVKTTYIYGGNKRFKTRKSRRGSRQKKNKKRKTKRKTKRNY